MTLIETLENVHEDLTQEIGKVRLDVSDVNTRLHRDSRSVLVDDDSYESVRKQATSLLEKLDRLHSLVYSDDGLLRFRGKLRNDRNNPKSGKSKRARKVLGKIRGLFVNVKTIALFRSLAKSGLAEVKSPFDLAICAGNYDLVVDSLPDQLCVESYGEVEKIMALDLKSPSSFQLEDFVELINSNGNFTKEEKHFVLVGITNVFEDYDLAQQSLANSGHLRDGIKLNATITYLETLHGAFLSYCSAK